VKTKVYTFSDPVVAEKPAVTALDGRQSGCRTTGEAAHKEEDMKRVFNILLAVMVLLSLAAAISTPVTAENNTINVPGDHQTIQEAIDAASDGDTIVVAAGSYKENVTIDKPLTLKGAQAGEDARNRSGAETIIEPDDGAGIRILTAANRIVLIDGFTVQNTLHGITTPELGVMAADIVVRNVRVLNSGEFGISLTFTEKTTVENCYVEGLEYGINAGALEPARPTEAVFRHNEVVDTRFGITGYLEDSLIEDNLVRDFAHGGIGISGQFLNTEIKDNTVTGYTKGGAITFEWHYGRELSRNVKVEGNTLKNNRIGVYVWDTQTELVGIAVNFNNISGNSYRGALNDSREILDAARNWWGASDGPRGFGPGSGDYVSSRAVFEPWLGAPLLTVQTETVIDRIMDVRAEADAEVEVDGTATVTVASYGDNPGDAPICLTPLDKYIDVYTPDTGDVDGIEIRLYYTASEAAAAGVAEESLRLFWWDGTEWVQCSEGGVDTDGADGYSGYIWARITGDSAPSLAQLTGTPFAGYELPPLLPYIATAELPDGRVGVAYNVTVHGCGGAEPYTWAVVDGALPDDLVYDADTGIISGTPTTAGVFNFTFKVTDSAQATATAELSITIPEPIPCFIATAAYGSNTAQDIDILREFRDSVMLSSSLGTGFVAIYYRASPTAAGFISRHDGLRTLVRVGLVDPIVRMLDRTRDSWAERN